MEIIGITEREIDAVLEKMFPMNELTREEARDRLEMEIEFAAVGGEGEWGDDEPTVSPFWIWLAMHERAVRDVAKLKPHERNAELRRIYADLGERVTSNAADEW